MQRTIKAIYYQVVSESYAGKDRMYSVDFRSLRWQGKIAFRDVQMERAQRV
jgi:hypothetical protein